MKIHFVGDLAGDREDYNKIIETIEDLGGELVTKHSLSRNLNQVEKETPAESESYAKKMIGWMKKSDVVVVEVSTPGLGSGYEIATALNLGRPVIVLYRPDGANTPYVLKAMEKNDKLQVLTYTDDKLRHILVMGLDYAEGQMDTRFNFFIAPKHQQYLDWVAKNKRIPRAVYLRRLIEADMKKNKDFA